MSPHRKADPSSCLSDTTSIGSTPSRSSSAESARVRNTKTRQGHHHHSSLAPSTFVSRSQSDGFTSKSCSSSFSTVVSSENEKATYSPSLASKIAAIPSTKAKKKAKSRSSTSENPKLKGERSCQDFDWSYRNVHSSGSTHGHKSIAGGSGPVGACVLM